MKILVLGGTQFVGRHIVEVLLAGGHSVSILTRGRTPDELPVRVERLAVIVQDTRAWLLHRETTPALSSEREAELIRIAH